MSMKTPSSIISWEGRIVTPLINRSWRSPDLPELRMYKYIPVLVYDSHQKGGILHHHLQGSRYLGMGHTVESAYKLYSYELDANTYIPVAFPHRIDDPNSYSLRGEVYLCSVEHLIVMDNHFRNGDSHTRVKRQVYLEEQEPADFSNSKYGEKPWCTAWVYQGEQEWYEDEKAEFTLCNPFRIRSMFHNKIYGERHYYQWTPPGKQQKSIEQGPFADLFDPDFASERVVWTEDGYEMIDEDEDVFQFGPAGHGHFGRVG